jgi:hypothetical protein
MILNPYISLLIQKRIVPLGASLGSLSFIHM